MNKTIEAIQVAARQGTTLDDLLKIFTDEDIDEALAPGRNWDGDAKRWLQFI